MEILITIEMGIFTALVLIGYVILYKKIEKIFNQTIQIKKRQTWSKKREYKIIKEVS